MLLPGLDYICDAAYACGCSCPIRRPMNLPWFFSTLFSSSEIQTQLIRIWLISENCRQNDLWKYCDPNTWELPGLFDGPLQGRIDLLGGMLLAHTDTKSVSKLKKADRGIWAIKERVDCKWVKGRWTTTPHP